MKSKLSFLIALLIAVGSAASCGGTETDDAVTTAPDSSEVSSAEDTAVRDSLPELDLEGREFNILIREEVDYEFDTEQTGELMDDVVFERNQNIGERFNLTINYIKKPGLWASASEYQGLISSAVLSGDSVYDIVTGQVNIVMPLAAQHYYIDTSNLQYLDFTQPYWKAGYMDNVKINGQLYTLCGDFARTALSCSNVIFFNKTLFDEYQIEYPYELVKSGSWTVDKFLEIATTINADLNGDSIIDVNDLHGFGGYNNSLNPFFYASGLSITSVDPSTGRQVVDFPNDKAIDLFDRFYQFVHSDSFFNTYDDLGGPSNTEEAGSVEFKNGKFAMFGMILEGVEYLRNMDVDFGIVPYPKYDEEQENYYTSILRRFTAAAIPITASDYEMSGLLLEALACEGYNEIVPAYYEIALKNKYARDENTVEMLDIISTSSWFSFADAYYTDLGTMSDFFSSYVLGSSEGVASKFDASRKNLEANLEKLYEAYENE